MYGVKRQWQYILTIGFQLLIQILISCEYGFEFVEIIKIFESSFGGVWYGTEI